MYIHVALLAALIVSASTFEGVFLGDGVTLFFLDEPDKLDSLLVGALSSSCNSRIQLSCCNVGWMYYVSPWCWTDNMQRSFFEMCIIKECTNLFEEAVCRLAVERNPPVFSAPCISVATNHTQ